MAFKKNGPGCCCGGTTFCGGYQCTGGGGNFGFRISFSGSPTQLPYNCPGLPTGGCTISSLSAITTTNFEYDCVDNFPAFPDLGSPSSSNFCGFCGSFSGITVNRFVLARVGFASDPVTSAAYDGVIAELVGGQNTLGPSTDPGCPTTCDDNTILRYQFPFTYNSGESGFGGSPNNCPTGFGTPIVSTTLATDNAVDVTGMSISITYISGLVP